MKNFYQWLNAFIAVIIIIVLTDLNIAWIKHPTGKTTMLAIRVGCGILLVALIVLNIIKQKSSKKE
jgi:cytochrome b561